MVSKLNPKFELVVALALVGVCAAAGEIIENGAFEDVRDGCATAWRLGGNFKALRGAGHNGNGGLVWEAAKPQGQLHVARQVLKGLKAGDLVKMSALVRKDGFTSGPHQGAVMSIEWHDKDDKWIKALYAVTRTVPDGEWTPIQASEIMPANAKSAVMVIYVSGESIGKVSWDNVHVEKVEAKPVSFVKTSAYRDLAVSGKVGFHAALSMPENADGPISAVFAWKDTNGEVCRRQAAKLTKDEAYIEIDVAEMAMGCQPVACGLYVGETRIGTAAVDFTRVDKIPERHVWIDEHGRCIVNGKPFFPIGMYWNPNPTPIENDDRTQLDWFTNGPFNCVIHYEMMDRQRLDYCQSIGLMTLNALDARIKRCATGRHSEPYTQEEAQRVLSERIAEVKDHPALLGWYIGDEVDVASVPYQRKAYKLIKAADEHHPIYGVQDRTHDLRPFANTMDVLGLDSYPVCQKSVNEVTKMVREGQAAVFATLPMWGVPQAFDWGWYPTNYKETRFPGLAEMRSINWQHIANGANGLFLFAFNCFFYPACKDDWRPRFILACESAREVARLSDVLLSVEPAPQGKIVTGKAVSRTWSKGGKAYLLVCGLEDRPSDVKVALSEGSWKIDGTELGTPAVMVGPNEVSFFLDAAGVSLVRLVGNR